jgi:hypothetical protein
MNKLYFILPLVIVFFGINSNSKAQMCPKMFGGELITNGGFESGNTGFTVGYTYQCCSMSPGTYSVGSNPNTLNSFYASMAAHTGTNMLIVDVDATPNANAYATNVTVIANTTYFFSAWFADINGTYNNPPQLKFSINGVQVGTTVNVDPGANSHAWTQFFVSWNSGAAAGSIPISIQNTNTISNGNDLGLDDISFSTSCANITNLATLGQTSVLPDTVSMCNVAFPYSLDPGLPGSYGLKWKQVPATTLATTSTYSIPPTPTDGTKYYLCYEYIAGCPRTDSVIFKTLPLSVNLGAPIVMCAPVNVTLNSGVTNPPVNVQWSMNGTPVATTANYTATDIGTYSVNLSRAGCGSATSSVVISNPASTISGSGTYCLGTNTTSFTVTGSSLVNWYIDNVSNTVLSTATTYTPAETATNTSIPGCVSGLYVADASSYPGTLIPASSVATAPCGSTSNYNGNSDLLVQINQPLTLSSVDYFQNSGWGNGTFTFSIYNNSAGAGPWCGGCSPGGNYDGPTGAALYTVTTASLTAPASGSLQRTLPVTYTFAPGKYWFRLSASGTAIGTFTCNQPLVASSNYWQTPYIDNTGNNAARAISSNYNNGGGAGTGSLFNIQFQVGASNACSRLFICATSNCAAPVVMIGFDVKKSFNGNSLVWKTASEHNSAYYIVQRSTDGINFEDIGRVAAAGNSSTTVSYNYTDNASANSGMIYYRLEQVDVDGTPHHSDIKSISNNGFFQNIHLYPVPVKKGQNASLEMISEANENILVEIYDNPGKVVSSGQYEVAEGTSTIELNTSILASGLYHLRITGSSSRTAKFVVE